VERVCREGQKYQLGSSAPGRRRRRRRRSLLSISEPIASTWNAANSII
jgi:hypothetical protein